MKTFRSTVAVILSVLMLLSVCTVASISASAESTNTIYLIPNENWENEGARFAAYFYNSADGKDWASMEDTNGDGTYEAIIPDGDWENIIFCRMDPTKPENTWENKWNQTGNLTLDSTNNCYTITAGSWEGEGTWSVIANEAPTKPTAPVEAGKVIVTSAFNGSELTTAKCDTNNVDLITVAFKLQSEKKIMNCLGALNYDGEALELVSFDMPNTPSAIYNTKINNSVLFNFSVVQNLYDFTTAKDFCVATFKAKADCNTTVALDIKDLYVSLDPDNATVNNDLALISGSEIVGTFALTSDVTIKKIKEDEVVKPVPKPSYKLKNSTINAGSRTRVTVYNANGQKVKFSSSKKTVASIDKNGIITGLQRGTTKLTIKVGTKVFYKNLKVKNDPTVKDGKKTLKNKKTIVVRKGQTKKLTITGKASAIKNKVSVKSKKIAKITSNSKQTKVVFKAKKKGKTTLTIKINGVKTYKYTIKVK